MKLASSPSQPCTYSSFHTMPWWGGADLEVPESQGIQEDACGDRGGLTSAATDPLEDLEECQSTILGDWSQ